MPTCYCSDLSLYQKDSYNYQQSVYSGMGGYWGDVGYIEEVITTTTDEEVITTTTDEEVITTTTDKEVEQKDTDDVVETVKVNNKSVYCDENSRDPFVCGRISVSPGRGQHVTVEDIPQFDICSQYHAPSLIEPLPHLDEPTIGYQGREVGDEL